MWLATRAQCNTARYDERKAPYDDLAERNRQLVKKVGRLSQAGTMEERLGTSKYVPRDSQSGEEVSVTHRIWTSPLVVVAPHDGDRFIVARGQATSTKAELDWENPFVYRVQSRLGFFVVDAEAVEAITPGTAGKVDEQNQIGEVASSFNVGFQIDPDKPLIIAADKVIADGVYEGADSRISARAFSPVKGLRRWIDITRITAQIEHMEAGTATVDAALQQAPNTALQNYMSAL